MIVSASITLPRIAPSVVLVNPAYLPQSLLFSELPCEVSRRSSSKTVRDHTSKTVQNAFISTIPIALRPYSPDPLLAVPFCRIHAIILAEWRVTNRTSSLQIPNSIPQFPTNNMSIQLNTSRLGHTTLFNTTSDGGFFDNLLNSIEGDINSEINNITSDIARDCTYIRFFPPITLTTCLKVVHPLSRHASSRWDLWNQWDSTKKHILRRSTPSTSCGDSNNPQLSQIRC